MLTKRNFASNGYRRVRTAQAAIWNSNQNAPTCLSGWLWLLIGFLLRPFAVWQYVIPITTQLMLGLLQHQRDWRPEQVSFNLMTSLGEEIVFQNDT